MALTRAERQGMSNRELKKRQSMKLERYFPSEIFEILPPLHPHPPSHPLTHSAPAKTKGELELSY